VDGVAVMTFGIEEELVQKLVEREFPLVFVDAGPDLPNIRVLKVNYAEGIRQAVQHLAALGHRSIAFITGPLRLRSAVARRDAFLKSMAELGLTVPDEHISVGDHTMEGGMAAMEKITALTELPTAVVCSNDMTAIGVLRAAYLQGLNVPRDLSVIGLDDIDFAEFTLPALTTIRLARADLARAAFDALRQHVDKSSNPVIRREFLVSTSLVVRGSTAPPPAGD
jgi:LacI family transcriptional regulator